MGIVERVRLSRKTGAVGLKEGGRWAGGGRRRGMEPSTASEVTVIEDG